MKWMQPLLTRALWVAGLTLVADQVVKGMIRESLAVCPPHERLRFCDHRVMLGPVWLVRVENPDGAFGVFQGWWIWLLVALAGCLILVYARRLRQIGWVAALAVGLQTGGALGNLVDRLRFGRVTDFIFPGSWTVLNLADLTLLTGMVLAVRLLLQARRTAGGTEVASAERPLAQSRTRPL